MKNCAPPQWFRFFLKKFVISFFLLPCLLLLVGVNTSAQAASLSATKAAGNPLVTVYLDHRKVHDFNSCATPIENCPVIGYVDKGPHPSECQAQGETVSDLGYTNNWWTKLQALSGKWGWVANIYIKGGVKIAGVPDCGVTNPPPVLKSGTWTGQGRVNGDRQPVAMNLTIKVTGNLFSGTLREDAYNTTVNITGKMNGATISFTDPSYVSGNGMALNILYTGTLANDTINGAWINQSPQYGKGTFTLKFQSPTLPPAPAPKSVSVLVFKEAETFPCIYPHYNVRTTSGCISNGKIQPNNYQAYCQLQGDYYSEGDRSNTWWALIQNGNITVWVSNLDIKGAAIIEGVPQGVDACKANAPIGSNVDGHP